MLRRDPSSRAALAAVAADISTFLTEGEVLSGAYHRASAHIPAVTGDERRLMTVILAESISGNGRAGTNRGVGRYRSDSAVPIGHLVTKHGGEMDVLPGGPWR
jgi:hypothetical protein